jgi:hypothetical protein
MGEHYVLVDVEGRNGLDVGKFYALACAAGLVRDSVSRPVTIETVREAAKGWKFDHRLVSTDLVTAAWQDVGYSAFLAKLVERWIVEVAAGRPVAIARESDAPWGVWSSPDSAWGTLWTLYTHPLTPGEAVPGWRLYPPKAP